MEVVRAIKAVELQGATHAETAASTERLLQLAQHITISPSEALRLVDPDGVNQVAPDREKATTAVAVYRAKVAAKTLAAIERLTTSLSENS